VYLPPLLEARPRVARYIATTSDHHAFLLRLEMAGVALLPEDRRRQGSSLYWKLNTAVLADPSFLPAFSAAWGPVLAERPLGPGSSAAWWESTAKPFIIGFCQRFSRLLAAKRFENRRFFTRALEIALEQGDWASVGSCRSRLRDMDAWSARGAAVRSHIPLVADELAGLFHVAAEGQHGQSPGLQSVRSAAGEILMDPEAVQHEVFSFYEAIL
jgi:hypothetical protein